MVMWSLPDALGMFTGSSIEEGLRLAYAVSELMTAGLVVGLAAVLAGLLGAAAVRKARVSRPPVSARAQLPWVLGVAVLASGVIAAPSDARLLCRKGESPRLVLRADGCRAREHAVDPRQLELAGTATCVESIGTAWHDLALLRTQLEDARSLAETIAEQPWKGAETWLRLVAAQITQTLARLDDTARALGVSAARDSIGRIRGALTEHWSHPADACSQALAIVPEIESVLPVPAAD
jgi:hypothetical protein